MNNREKYMQIKPPPPNNLDSKSLAIWASWSTMGEKEVAREAVMKGTHIELAKQFLTKKLDIDNTEKWFKNEINSWTLDLLLRKQLYRATHVIENLGNDAFEEMLAIFLDTCSKELRQNVGNHLMKHEKISQTYINNWCLLTAIENESDNILNFKEKHTSFNLNYINQQTDEWRRDIGTLLFFRTFDFSLKEFINTHKAWTCLLKSNVDLLKYWINLYYAKDYIDSLHFLMQSDAKLNADILSKLKDIFINLNIDDDMIRSITNDEYSLDTKVQNEVLNELAKYGVFREQDRSDLTEIIKRLSAISGVQDIQAILESKFSNLSLDQFKRLLINYCDSNGLFNILNICSKDFLTFDEIDKTTSQSVNLILSNRRLCKNLYDSEIFNDSILETAVFLAKNSLLDYFSGYPLVLLSLILFTKDISIRDLLSKKVTVKIREFEINKEILMHCFKDYHYFIDFSNKFQPTNKKTCLNYYELLRKHLHIRTENIYSFRFESQLSLPNFSSVDLIERYGYKKNLDFIYFLKDSRPMYAYKIFKRNYLNGDISKFDYMKYMEKIYRVALRNFNSVQITTSCVVFVELLGENSYPLRIYLKAANIIFALQKEKLTRQDIIGLFSKITENHEEIFTLLESSLIKTLVLHSDMSGAVLISALKSYDIVVKFAQLHKLQLPELFLKYCAQRDLWLPFLIYIQIYNYPIDVSSKLVQNFLSKSLIEHLGHAISYDIQLEDFRNQLIGERDSRKFLLSRLGLRLTDSSGGSSDLSSHSSYGSMANSVGSDFLDSETLDYHTDLLGVLIKCHNSVDPPKALLYACRYYKIPLLAVLSNSYEPDSVITNWVTWLEVSCDIEESFINYDGVITADSVLEMFRNIIKKNYFKTLTNSFAIFLPENPLSIFMEFLTETTRLNFNANVQELLQTFKKKITYWRSNSFITEIDHDMSYFNNKLWIQRTAIFLLCVTLQYGFQCCYDQILFLRFLNDIDIEQYFLTDFPDVKAFLKIVEYLHDNRCQITFDLSVMNDKNKFHHMIRSYINELVEEQLYEVALNLAKIMDLPCTFILTKQLKNEFDTSSTREEGFWKKWDGIFEVCKAPPKAVVKNYVKYLENTEDNFERFTILRLAFAWAKRNKLEGIFDLEKDMWSSFFQLDDCQGKIEMVSKGDFTSYMEYSKELEIIPDCYDVLDEKTAENFETVIEHLLNIGDIGTALRLEKFFGCTNIDLDILKLCLLLVEGILSPYQLSARQRLLLNRRNNIKGSINIRRKTYLTPRISSCNSATSLTNLSVQVHLNDTVIAPSHDTLALLEMLVDNLKCGSSLASKIFKTYRISVNLQMKYQMILECEDTVGTLKKALEDDCRNKLEVVSDFIDIFKLNKEEITDLLYGEIITAIVNYSFSKMTICMLWDMQMDMDFSLVLKLLPDSCSLLGFKLYYGCGNEFTSDNLMRVTELLIRSHDCFTADCNMEGISMVLKKCKTFTSTLEGMQDYNLMVRLLTGIGRYTEMTYIFHMLKQQEQFELLLRRGSRKDGGLKMALLEYLKKYCPDDVDLYKIVALHFFLFSEIAELWEQEAVRYTQRIIALAKLEMQNYRLNPDTEPYLLFLNTEDNKKMLRKIMTKYSHAAEYHLHGQKLTKAMTAAKQAQLLALQLSLFKDVNQGAMAMCILNLSSGQLNRVILSEFSFQQILIVVEAYSFEADWASVLYEQFLNKNRTDFFQSFVLSFPITGNLAQDVSRLLMSHSKITAAMNRNMRTLLSRLNSIHEKYRVASELGFTDVIEELLNSHQLSYLKDTVWKSGYRNVDN